MHGIYNKKLLLPLILFANCCQESNSGLVFDLEKKTIDQVLVNKEKDSSGGVKPEKRKIEETNDHDVKRKKGENNDTEGSSDTEGNNDTEGSSDTEIISPSQQELY